MGCDLSVEGFDNVMRKLEVLGTVGSKVINQALTDGAQPILENMKNTDLFEDRTGKARAALKISSVKSRKGRKQIWIGDVDRQAIHLWYLENGTPRIVARPFMRAAYRQKREEASKCMKESLMKSFKELGGNYD